MRLFFMAFCLISTLLVGCREGAMLYISGDSKAVGADVYIDGQLVGIMEKVTDSETGHIGAGAEMRLLGGKHKVKIVNKEGKELTIEIEMKGPNYIHVKFEKMIIEN
jgi:hypothetical protein